MTAFMLSCKFIVKKPLRGVHAYMLMVFCLAGMIIFLVPIVGALTTRFAHFDMIHLGSYLSALSPLWIVAFPDHGMPLRSALRCSPSCTKLRVCPRTQSVLNQLQGAALVLELACHLGKA